MFFFPAVGKAEGLGCIREVVDAVLWGFLCVLWGFLCVLWDFLCVLWGFLCAREKEAVVTKVSHSEGLLKDFRVCEETPKVEQIAICSETEVHAI